MWLEKPDLLVVLNHFTVPIVISNLSANFLLRLNNELWKS